MAFQKALVLVAGELAAAVRMQDDRRTRRRTEGREDTANPTRARRGKPWRQPRASLKPHVQAVQTRVKDLLRTHCINWRCMDFGSLVRLVERDLRARLEESQGG